ncbi:cupin domain-containing protein [Acidiphilium sp.]|uniref:cupin domain-containing protein n=1 Tax=Acidiphilium sp. TaxID=527 RepID=UPI003CFF7439
MDERAKAIPTVRIDNGRVKATEWMFAPGAETGRHRHEHDYVVVPLTDGELLIEHPDGTSVTSQLIQGIPYANVMGVDHNVVNSGKANLAFLEIEITG